MDQVLDDLLAGDYEALRECIAEGGAPLVEGYWSPFSTLAWIASQNEGFLAGVQRFEVRNHASMGKPHSWPTWIVCGNLAGIIYGKTFSDASELLRLALVAGRLKDGIATNERTGELIEVQRADWTRWSIAHHNWGLSLIPGLIDFQWPAENVLAAFAPSGAPQPAEQQEAAKLGRPAGAGRYVHTDPRFVEAMRKAITDKSVGSIEEAAQSQWPECGGATPEAAASRLRRKYRAVYPN